MDFLKLSFLFALSFLSQLTTTRAQGWVSYESEQQVNDLVDNGEELLLATDAGIVQVDKVTLETTNFNTANTNLNNNHVQAITRSPNGETWIGTYDVVLSRFDGTGFTDEIMPDHESIDQYTELYDFQFAPNGDLWLATSDGVLWRQGDTWLHYDVDELGPSFFQAWSIAINEAGEVYMASFDVHKFTDGTWSNLTEATELNGYLDAELFFSTSGDLYVAGDLDQIGRFDGQNWQLYDIDLNGSEVIGFTEDTAGNIYFNTQRDGIFKLENDVWVQQADAQAAAVNNITPYFYIDGQNQRWMNSNILLSRNDNGNIQSTIISEHRLESNRLRDVHKSQDGKLYFILLSTNNLAVLAPDGTWSFLPMPELAMSAEFFNDILAVSDNDIWLASSEGLYHYDGTEWTFTDLETCRGLVMDSQGVLYIRSADRVYILENGAMTEYNTGNSPIADLIISGMGVDANDNLWITAFDWDGGNAIQHIATDGTWTTYTSADHAVIDRPVGDVRFDQEGNVWVINDQIGALKFDGQTWKNPFLENLDQITNTDVSAIEIDAMGKLYFAHQYGMTTLFNGEWENLINEAVSANLSHESKLEIDDAGTLWWANSRYGLFSYSSETTTATEPTLELSSPFSIYPNPVQDQATLDFAIPANAKVKAGVYNQLGQLVSSVDLGQLPVGTYQQKMELGHLPKGFYVLKLQINEDSFTKKLLVQ